MTYYLNRLQSLESDVDWCVTLNGDVPDEHVVDRGVFEHPLFTPDSLAAQRELPSLAGVRRTWFAGAHHGNGFHEDGLASGVRAAAVDRSRLVRSAIYEGTLMHARRTPVRNVFRYPVSYWLLDLDELPELDRRLALFSHGGRNVVSLPRQRPLRRRTVCEGCGARARRRRIGRACRCAHAAARRSATCSTPSRSTGAIAATARSRAWSPS